MPKSVVTLGRNTHWDNAPTESLWASLKVGRLYGRRFATRRQAMDEVIDWLAFYNHRRQSWLRSFEHAAA